MIAPFKIESTLKTPAINFNAETGYCSIGGRSIPENSLELYQPVMEWIKSYVKNPAAITTFDFKLTYFNSSSAEFILSILKALDQIHQSGKQVEINWYFEADDEDMQLVGEDFDMLINAKINLIVAQGEL